MISEEKIQALIAAIRAAKEGNPDVQLPRWEDAPLLNTLVDELQEWNIRAISTRNQAVEQERDLYETIFNQIPADVVIIDRNYRYLFLSKVAVKDPELRQWLIGKTDYEYCAYRGIDPQLAFDRQAILDQALSTRKPVQLMEVRPDRDGIVRHKRRMLSPVLNHEGETILFVGHGMDVTDLAETERSLREQNAALEKANYELDQFVYRASHDLRAPLASVTGLIELAQQSELPADAVQYLALMARATAKMDSFIRDIVDHSKNSRQDLHIEAIDLAEEVESALQQLGFMKGADQVDIRLNLRVEAPFYSDRFRIGVLLNNLISNAVKYQDPHKPHPYVELEALVTRDTVRLSIQDNGIGISEQHTPHVFEMFYRASNAAPGTGIGLYIVQEIAHKLGGRATLQSQPGIGTTVSLEFPNRKAPDPA